MTFFKKEILFGPLCVLINRREAINDLPERCRTVFLLNRQEGLSSREIAEALSLSESTVRVQIKIAVDRIVAGIRTHYPDLKLVSLLLFLFTARF